ncbi:hypothetical protein [Emticicia fontis]
MNKANKKEEYNLSCEPQPEKKDWIKPESIALEVNNGGSVVADSTADQHS